MTLQLCSFGRSRFYKQSSLIIQVLDEETKLAIDNISVKLTIEGQASGKRDENVEHVTDARGRVQFDALPKIDFTILISETETNHAYDTTYTIGSIKEYTFYDLSVSLIQKRTTFIGKIQDAEDNSRIDRALVEIPELTISSFTDTHGTYSLTAQQLNQRINYQLRISKMPYYHTLYVDIYDFKANSINDQKTMTLKRANEWIPPITGGKGQDTEIDSTRSPYSVKYGG